MERVKLSLLRDSVLIQSLSLYYLKTAQVLQGNQCSTSQKERRNGQERTNSFPREANVVAGERGASVLLSALKQEWLCRPSFLHLGRFSLIVSYVSPGGNKKQLNSP